LRAEGLAEKTDSDQWLRSLDSVLGGSGSASGPRDH
jgi:sulfate permease, SulP family